MTQRKPFKELDLSNAFLFSAALQDEETCQLVLEMLLGIPIGKVKVKAEHSIFCNMWKNPQTLMWSKWMMHLLKSCMAR